MSNKETEKTEMDTNKLSTNQGKQPWLNKKVKQREFDYHPGSDRNLVFRGERHYKIHEGDSVVVIVSNGMHTRQSVLHRPFGEGVLPANAWVVSDPEELDQLRLSEAEYSKAVSARKTLVSNQIKNLILTGDADLLDFVKTKLDLDLNNLSGMMDLPTYQKIKKEATKLRDEEVASYKTIQNEKNFEMYLDKEIEQNKKRSVKDQFSEAKLANLARERINKEVSNKKFPIENYYENAAKVAFPGNNLDAARILFLCNKWKDVMALDYQSGGPVTDKIDDKLPDLPKILNRSGDQQRISIGLAGGKSSADVVNDVHRLLENGLSSNLRVPFPNVFDVWRRLSADIENASKVSEKVGQLEAKIKAYEKFVNTLFLDVSREDDIEINKIKRTINTTSKKTTKKWSLFGRARSPSPPKAPEAKSIK